MTKKLYHAPHLKSSFILLLLLLQNLDLKQICTLLGVVMFMRSFYNTFVHILTISEDGYKYVAPVTL